MGTKPRTSSANAPALALLDAVLERLDDSSAAEIEIESRGTKVRVSRGAVHTAAPAIANPASAVTVPEATTADEHNYHVVTSPFVGTFYRRANPEADVYVAEGQTVAEGQVLCIVEAMKLMNEIEADAAGTVVKILVADKDHVEYGQPLFYIE